LENDDFWKIMNIYIRKLYYIKNDGGLELLIYKCLEIKN
jgi:hypothetical protein